MVSNIKEMINWPAIIKHSDDPELTFISNQAEWDSDVDLHNVKYDEADFIVDSTGKIYTLTTTHDLSVQPQETGNSKSLKEILGLAKAHAAQQGSCCVAKLSAPSIKDAFKIIASLSDT